MPFVERLLLVQVGVFFLQGFGGTGKTFLINLVLAKIRADGGIALSTASSGIAATLLDGGTTAHSRFKIPVMYRARHLTNWWRRNGNCQSSFSMCLQFSLAPFFGTSSIRTSDMQSIRHAVSVRHVVNSYWF
jgi:PIF1-like helicase